MHGRATSAPSAWCAGVVQNASDRGVQLPPRLPEDPPPPLHPRPVTVAFSCPRLPEDPRHPLHPMHPLHPTHPLHPMQSLHPCRLTSSSGLTLVAIAAALAAAAASSACLAALAALAALADASKASSSTHMASLSKLSQALWASRTVCVCVCANNTRQQQGAAAGMRAELLLPRTTKLLDKVTSELNTKATLRDPALSESVTSSTH